MKIKNIAVIITADDGNTYQVALSNDKLEALKSDLSMYYFPDGIIKVTNKLDGVEINELIKE